MATNSVVNSTSNQLTVQVDLSKIFVWDNRYDSAAFTNGTGATITMLAGTLMGKISATGKLVPLTSAAADGSQYPVGILASDYSVLAGATKTLTFCNSGDVVKNKVILTGADTLSTVIAGRSIQDRIGADTLGIKLVDSTENTNYDN